MNFSSGTPSLISLKKAFHKGAAMNPATLFTISELSLLPNHTPHARFGVYPTTQASRESFVVPVLAATSLPGKYKGEVEPNDGVLAALSASISFIRRALS